jgi:hypothetical protein
MGEISGHPPFYDISKETSLKNKLSYETDKKSVDQTDAKKPADLFRVHLLRGRSLIERG